MVDALPRWCQKTLVPRPESSRSLLDQPGPSGCECQRKAKFGSTDGKEESCHSDSCILGWIDAAGHASAPVTVIDANASLSQLNYSYDPLGNTVAKNEVANCFALILGDMLITKGRIAFSQRLLSIDKSPRSV